MLDNRPMSHEVPPEVFFVLDMNTVTNNNEYQN